MPKTAQKRPQRRPQPKRRAHKPGPQRTQTALMRISAPPAQPWNLTQDEVGLIKNHVAKGASDEELKFCLAVARRRKLDPFKGQIWFVKRRDKTAEGGARWIPMTSIDGLLHLAARDHKDFGSSDEPEFGPMKEVKWSYFEKSGKFMAPEWARVSCWKKGATRPTVCTVYWDEIYPDAGASPMVREKPRLMLAKCALAQVTRRAYPDTGGLYIPEEFQGPPEFTPEGREIVVKEAPVSEAEERYKQHEEENIKRLSPDQQEVLRRKMREAEARKNAPIDIQTPRAASNPQPKQEETPAPQLVYRYYAESDSWRIGGTAELVKAHMDLLQPLWNQVAKPPAFVANAKQLGHLIRQFEIRKVPFREYGAQREPGE